MSEFANVLRSWRDRVRPEEVGLPAGAGRRTPGLRREELAALAGVSVDYVVRLEQGRATNPSPQLLGALATALRLTDEERDHLYRVGRRRPAVAPASSRGTSRPACSGMVDRLGDVPLAVFSATHDIAAVEHALGRGERRPVAARRARAQPRLAALHAAGATASTATTSTQEEFSSDLAADLRARRRALPGATAPSRSWSRGCCAASPEFARRWGEAKSPSTGRAGRPCTRAVGPITIDCDVLTVPGGDLRIVVYTVVPGLRGRREARPAPRHRAAGARADHAAVNSQRRVLTAEPERVVQRCTERSRPGAAGDDVEVHRRVEPVEVQGRRHGPGLERPQGQDRLDRAGGAEHVPDGALRSGDQRSGPHRTADGGRLADVADRGAGRVRVHVVDVRAGEARHPDRRASWPAPARCRRPAVR